MAWSVASVTAASAAGPLVELELELPHASTIPETTVSARAEETFFIDPERSATHRLHVRFCIGETEPDVLSAHVVPVQVK